MILVSLAAEGRQTPDYDALYRQTKDMPTSDLAKLGRDLFSRNSMDSALAVYTIVSNRFESGRRDEDRHFAVEARNSIGVINFLNGNYASAYSNYVKAGDIDGESGTASLINLSAIYRYYGDKRRAFDLLREVLNRSIKNGNSYHASVAMVNIMTSDLEDIISADSLSDMIKLYEEKVPRTKDNPGWNLASHLSRARLYALNGDNHLAVKEYKMALPSVSTMLLPERSSIMTYEQLGKTFANMGEKDSSIYYLKEAERLASENNYAELLVSTYSDISEVYSLFGEKELADEYKNRKLQLAESALQTKELSRIHELEMLHEADEFESRINRLSIEQRLKTRILIIVLVALVLLSVSFIYILIQYRTLRRKNRFLFESNIQAMKEESVKYSGSALTEETGEILEERIRKVMSDESNYCREGFCLKDLAVLCNSNSKYVSQVLNERMGTTFSKLLTDCRINEARKRFVDFDTYGHMTIEAIVADLGFKSRSTFSKTFKRITGLSPSEFQRLARQNPDQE